MEREIKQAIYEKDVEFKKNVQLEDQNLKNRQQITLLDNRDKFLKCDIKVKKEEVGILNENKADLTNQNQNNIIKGDSLKRSLE